MIKYKDGQIDVSDQERINLLIEHAQKLKDEKVISRQVHRALIRSIRKAVRSYNKQLLTENRGKFDKVRDLYVPEPSLSGETDKSE